MSTKSPQVWECEHRQDIAATPQAIWSLLSDVATWPRWNAGVAHIELHGGFRAGTDFTMRLPDGTALRTRLVEVNPRRNFLDRTQLGELCVFVDHRLEPLSAQLTRVVFALEAFGPDCDEAGRAIAADFPDVLRALARHAESLPSSGTA